MARSNWNDARTRGERASFDYFKESLTVLSGELVVTLDAVLDASQERDIKMRSPDGTFPVLARLLCWRDDLGFLPSVNEAIRVLRADMTTEEQVYLVTSVDQTSPLLVIELQANTNNANPFFQ